MDEIIILSDRSENEIALEINIIKKRAARDMLSAAIEIGKLLCEAKGKVAHGEWGDWLRNNVAYSISNANNMMRLYQEREAMAQADLFGNNDVNVFEGLTTSQAVALLSLPRNERKAFVEDHDAKEMSTREWEAAIRAQKEAEEDAKKAREEAKAEFNRAEIATQNADALAGEKKALEAQLEELETEVEELRAMPVPEDEVEKIKAEAQKKANEEAKEKIAAAKEKADKAIEKAKKEGAEQLSKAQKEWEEEKAKLAEEARKAAENESAEKLRALEAQLREAKTAASPFLTQFKIHMESLKLAYSKMLTIVEEAEQREPETGEKLRRALGAIKDSLK